jgi:hypothetical protein
LRHPAARLANALMMAGGTFTTAPTMVELLDIEALCALILVVLQFDDAPLGRMPLICNHSRLCSWMVAAQRASCARLRQ